MDNLGFHKSDEVMDLYDELDIMPILNVGYSPDFNPIESVFSIVKNNYKRARMHSVVTGKYFNHFSAINKAFRTITKEVVTKFKKKSYAMLVNSDL